MSISKIKIDNTEHELVASQLTSTSAEKVKLDATNIAYGTCSTAAATAAKVITISGNTQWLLTAGSRITVKFTYTNSASNPTFNVNGTGAKSVWYNTGLITTANKVYAGTANRPMDFVYDGTQFVFIGWSVDTNTTYTNASLGQGYGTCATAETTTAKVVTLSSYALTPGGVVSVKFTYAVPANATLNINSKGAKSIYYRGTAITANVIKAGDVATFIYDGSQYHLIATDRWQEDIADAKTYADNAANQVKNDLLNGAGGAYDTLKELGDLIDDNTDAIDALKQVAANKADKTHNHSASNIISGTLAIERGGTGNMNGYVQIGALSGSTVGALATAEGRNTTASGSYSHAEGNYTEATGSSSHAEGQNSTASGTAAHAEGENTTASGAYSHAEGENTLASSKHQHVQGKFNKEDTAGTYAHIVGNGTGTSSSKRSNAHTLDWNGNAWFAGNIYVGGTSQNSGATMVSSITTLTTAEYTALEQAEATNANTLYMLTDAEEEVLITVEDIDAICGATIAYASLDNEVTF